MSLIIKEISTKKEIKEFIRFPDRLYLGILDETNSIIAFGITILSLSKAHQKAKGKLYPFGFIHFLNALRKNDTANTLLIAVRKDYRNKGVNGIIFNDIMSSYMKNGITNLESTRELESNTKVNNLWNKFEYSQHKRTRCYIKEL